MAKIWTAKAAVLAATVGLGTMVLAGSASAIPLVLSPAPSGHDVLDFKFGGYTAENVGIPTGNSGGRETTWGIGYISEIDNFSTGDNRIWDGNGANPQGASVDFIIYGIADDSFAPGTPGVLKNSGCTVDAGPFTGCDGYIHVDFYILSGTDPARSSVTSSDRSGFSTVDGINGISDVSTLLMSWILVPGDLNNDGDSTTTLTQNVNGDVLPTTGSGHFLADCISGPGCNLLAGDQFQLNGLTSYYGDLLGAFTLHSCAAPIHCTAAGYYPNGFGGFINDPVFGVAVPEPGTLAILGAGLSLVFGFGARARKRR